MNAFWLRLQRDLQASWQKTALLGGLFVVGCWFWTPLPWSLLRGKTVQAADSTGPDVAVVQPVTPPVTTDSPVSWTELDRLLERAPDAGEGIVPLRDPFQPNYDERPILGLFAEEAPVLDLPRPSAPQVTTREAPGLDLQSTFISRQRRGALINGRTVYEGQSFEWQGERWQVTEVAPHRVVLGCGSALVELRLTKPLAAEVTAR